MTECAPSKVCKQAQSPACGECSVACTFHCRCCCLQGVLVKVYELICWKLYTSTQADADLNLELAGVVPTSLITLQTPADTMVR